MSYSIKSPIFVLLDCARVLKLILRAFLARKKFQKVVVQALGHLCMDVELFNLISKRSNYNSVILVPVGKPANSLLYSKLKASYEFCPENLVALLDNILKLPIIRSLRADIRYELEDYELLDKSPSPISMSPREFDLTYSFLTSKGWKVGQAIVCICVRDDGFDETRHKREVIDELDYRNSDISLFSSAINELINRGYFVIRMGRNSKKQLTDGISGYYDYSSQEVYDEVIELGVFALSEFTISTEYGVDEVAAMFRKPVILLNHLPVGQVRRSYLRPYSLPKRIIDTRERRELTVSDLLLRKSINLLGKSSYSNSGCMYLDNSHKEILNSLKEYLEIRELIVTSKERLGSTEAQVMLYPDRLNQPVVSSFWVSVN